MIAREKGRGSERPQREECDLAFAAARAEVSTGGPRGLLEEGGCVNRSTSPSHLALLQFKNQ